MFGLDKKDFKNASILQKGFTLVELMVVIAIMGILAAIGVPKLISYMRNADASDATKNLGNLHSAIYGYAGVAGYSKAVAALASKVASSTASTLQSALGTMGWTPTQGTKFDYTVSTIAGSGDSNFTFCLIASANSRAAATGPVVWHSTLQTADGWTDHYNSGNYVSGASTSCPSG